MIGIQNPLFVEQIQARKLLPPEEMTRLLGFKQDALRLFRYLVTQQILPRREAAQLWADAFGVAWIDLSNSLFQEEVVQLLPQAVARKYGIMFVYQMGTRTGHRAETITVAMSNPSDKAALQEAERITQRALSPVCALPDDIQDAIDIQYQDERELQEIDKRAISLLIEAGGGEISASSLAKLAGSQAMVDLTRAVLLLATKEGASDIHVEPFETHSIIRFRIDGMLRERGRLSQEVFTLFISRIKVLSGLDITEQRRPHDGRLRLELTSRVLDFRVSTVPAIYGEKLVMRLLSQLNQREVPDLESLNFSKNIFDQVKQIILSPNGIFFLTGPTGSGKSTTLFAAIKAINNSAINIMTVEDPVEYSLPGINQVQVNPAIGLTFAVALRAFLRQDPDVILIGEIRDLETAKIATEAALTGHLVLSSLHTNSALQAVTRLIEIGVEPFLVGPSLIGVMSQRLVRRICPHCKESYAPDRKTLDALFQWDGKKEVLFYRGNGCQQCKNTGYIGRLAIHEMVTVSDEMRRLVIERGTSQQVYEAALKVGYQSMRYDGIKKALRGLTSLEEVNRVAPWD
ncbi:MAG: type II/IV secretion system protein [Magnetococcales bacterium]|nr:type II/IV secretion system protein [Magnetococcales bacterium]